MWLSLSFAGMVCLQKWVLFWLQVSEIGEMISLIIGSNLFGKLLQGYVIIIDMQWPVVFDVKYTKSIKD